MSQFARVYAAQPHYLDGKIITVEVDIAQGMHRFDIVGLPNKAVDEARSRVGSALRNSGFTSPKHTNHKTTVSLAPAEIRKEGASFDVAIAVGYLLAHRDITFDPSDKIFLGELLLNGEVASIHGVLPLAYAARQAGFKELFVPYRNAREASYIKDMTVYPITTLAELVHHLTGDSPIQAYVPPSIDVTERSVGHIDYADIAGQEVAKRGLMIAAAGGHNVALYGPPGTGKTMLAQACRGLLPPLSEQEMFEVTCIHSIAGILEKPLCIEAPFRSPHHTASYVSIIGGGSHPRPGEITLAHRGILFLDEFPEFDQQVIEALRQPLEDRIVHISRAHGSATFPANFMLIAAMNPCPCGYYGSPTRECVCLQSSVKRYQQRLSGPIVDRIDMWIPVEHIPYEKFDRLRENSTTPSTKIYENVVAARKLQHTRFENQTQLNAHMNSREVGTLDLDAEVRSLLIESARALSLSPRSYYRMIKLARTIADVEGSSTITASHVLEALQYRPKL